MTFIRRLPRAASASSDTSTSSLRNTENKKRSRQKSPALESLPRPRKFRVLSSSEDSEWENKRAAVKPRSPKQIQKKPRGKTDGIKRVRIDGNVDMPLLAASLKKRLAANKGAYRENDEIRRLAESAGYTDGLRPFFLRVARSGTVKELEKDRLRRYTADLSSPDGKKKTQVVLLVRLENGEITKILVDTPINSMKISVPSNSPLPLAENLKRNLGSRKGHSTANDEIRARAEKVKYFRSLSSFCKLITSSTEIKELREGKVRRYTAYFPNPDGTTNTKVALLARLENGEIIRILADTESNLIKIDEPIRGTRSSGANPPKKKRFNKRSKQEQRSEILSPSPITSNEELATDDAKSESELSSPPSNLDSSESEIDSSETEEFKFTRKPRLPQRRPRILSESPTASGEESEAEEFELVRRTHTLTLGHSHDSSISLKSPTALLAENVQLISISSAAEKWTADTEARAYSFLRNEIAHTLPERLGTLLNFDKEDKNDIESSRKQARAEWFLPDEHRFMAALLDCVWQACQKLAIPITPETTDMLLQQALHSVYELAQQEESPIASLLEDLNQVRLKMLVYDPESLTTHASQTHQIFQEVATDIQAQTGHPISADEMWRLCIDPQTIAMLKARGIDTDNPLLGYLFDDPPGYLYGMARAWQRVVARVKAGQRPDVDFLIELNRALHGRDKNNAMEVDNVSDEEMDEDEDDAYHMMAVNEQVPNPANSPRTLPYPSSFETGAIEFGLLDGANLDEQGEAQLLDRAKRIQEKFGITIRLDAAGENQTFSDELGRRFITFIREATDENSLLAALQDAFKAYEKARHRPNADVLLAQINLAQEIDQIHPFGDGNIRICQLLLNCYALMEGKGKRPFIFDDPNKLDACHNVGLKEALAQAINTTASHRTAALPDIEKTDKKTYSLSRSNVAVKAHKHRLPRRNGRPAGDFAWPLTKTLEKRLRRSTPSHQSTFDEIKELAQRAGYEGQNLISFAQQIALKASPTKLETTRSGRLWRYPIRLLSHNDNASVEEALLMYVNHGRITDIRADTEDNRMQIGMPRKRRRLEGEKGQGKVNGQRAFSNQSPKMPLHFSVPFSGEAPNVLPASKSSDNIDLFSGIDLLQTEVDVINLANTINNKMDEEYGKTRFLEEDCQYHKKILNFFDSELSELINNQKNKEKINEIIFLCASYYLTNYYFDKNFDRKEAMEFFKDWTEEIYEELFDVTQNEHEKSTQNQPFLDGQSSSIDDEDSYLYQPTSLTSLQQSSSLRSPLGAFSAPTHQNHLGREREISLYSSVSSSSGISSVSVEGTLSIEGDPTPLFSPTEQIESNEVSYTRDWFRQTSDNFIPIPPPPKGPIQAISPNTFQPRSFNTFQTRSSIALNANPKVPSEKQTATLRPSTWSLNLSKNEDQAGKLEAIRLLKNDIFAAIAEIQEVAKFKAKDPEIKIKGILEKLKDLLLKEEENIKIEEYIHLPRQSSLPSEEFKLLIFEIQEIINKTTHFYNTNFSKNFRLTPDQIQLWNNNLLDETNNNLLKIIKAIFPENYIANDLNRATGVTAPLFSDLPSPIFTKALDRVPTSTFKKQAARPEIPQKIGEWSVNQRSQIAPYPPVPAVNVEKSGKKRKPYSLEEKIKIQNKYEEIIKNEPNLTQIEISKRLEISRTTLINIINNEFLKRFRSIPPGNYISNKLNRAAGMTPQASSDLSPQFLTKTLNRARLSSSLKLRLSQSYIEDSMQSELDNPR